MNLAIDVTGIHPERHAPTAHFLIREFQKHLSEMPESTVHVLTDNGNLAFFKQFENERVSCLAVTGQGMPPKTWFPAMILRLKRLFVPSKDMLMQRNISLVVCLQPSTHWLGTHIPVVTLVHDVGHAVHTCYFQTQELAERQYIWERLRTSSSFFLCPTHYTHKLVQSAYGIPETSLTYLPLRDLVAGVVTQDPTHLPELNRISTSNKKYILYPEDFKIRTNHQLFLVAFNMFVRKYPHHDVCLVLSGKGTKVLAAAAENMGISERVIMIDVAEEGERLAMAVGAFAIAFPSLYEDSPFTLQWILDQRKPIIASNTACIPEILGNAAIYFDPRKPDEIVECLKKVVEEQVSCGQTITPLSKRVDASKTWNACMDYLVNAAGSAGRFGGLCGKGHLPGTAG